VFLDETLLEYLMQVEEKEIEEIKERTVNYLKEEKEFR